MIADRCRENFGQSRVENARSHRRSLARTRRAARMPAYGAWKRPNTPYDDFMEAQGIPIFRGIGVRRVQDMPLKPLDRAWAATAPSSSSTAPRANGAATWSRCRAPARSIPKSHMYEEIMVVVEGRGTTEIWTDGQNEAAHLRVAARLDVLDPAQHQHRIINAASSPALILVALDRAQRDEHLPRYRLDLQLPGHLPVALRRQRRTSSSPRTTSCPIRCAAWRCAKAISSPTS